MEITRKLGCTAWFERGVCRYKRCRGGGDAGCRYGAGCVFGVGGRNGAKDMYDGAGGMHCAGVIDGAGGMHCAGVIYGAGGMNGAGHDEAPMRQPRNAAGM